MNEKTDLVVSIGLCVWFGIGAVMALIGVLFCGAEHQIITAVICASMCWANYSEAKKWKQQ